MSRVFIVGNGPSLRETPLERLKGEVSIGFNNIDWIYKDVDWIPNFYLAYDAMEEGAWKHWDWARMVWRNMALDCYERMFIRSGIMGHTTRKFGFQYDSNVTWISTCKEHPSDLRARPTYRPDGSCYDQIDPPDSWHSPYLCGFPSAVHVAIQIFAYSGHFDEIYLLGCDGGEEHFVEDYPTPPRGDEALLLGHEIARKECDAREIKVFNATVGGGILKKHKIYPNRDIFKLLKE